MHPEVTDSEESSCPKCGMKLVPADKLPGAGEGEREHRDHGEHEAHEHGGHEHAQDHADGLEWEDLMPEINRQTNTSNMIWQLIDQETGAENAGITWAFRVGDRIKIRLANEMDQDHPMHHPFHIHGAGRFLVLSRDGEPEQNLVWKDTVLLRAGQTIDILLDVTNPGLWMAHCHIAEHTESGMMFSFDVAPAEDPS
jgi:FtsP/CotA-like multicopper oxidase with cupredoxin domain